MTTSDVTRQIGVIQVRHGHANTYLSVSGYTVTVQITRLSGKLFQIKVWDELRECTRVHTHINDHQFIALRLAIATFKVIAHADGVEIKEST